MKHIMVILLLTAVAFNANGQSALNSIKQKKQPYSSTAKPPTEKIKKGLSDHQRPDKVEDSRVGNAFATLERGDGAAAIDQFDDYSDTDADAAYGLGLAYYMNDQTDEAITSLSHAIELDNQSTDAYYLLGVIYAEQGNFEKSSDALVAMLEIDDQDADGWYLLGFICHESGDPEDAQYCLSKVLEIDPDYPDAEY